ncbi:MAG: type II secretion system F family protein [Dehalococcoidia bacterium]
MIPLLVAMFAAATVALLTFGLMGRQTAGSAARARLSAIGGSYAGNVPIWMEPDLLRPRRKAHLPMLEMLVQTRSWAARLEMDLAQAAIPMRGSEFVLLRIMMPVVFFAGATVMGASPIIAGIFAGVGYFVPRFWLSFKKNGRINKLNRQLPEAIQLVASSLKAGFALLQAFEAAADRAPQPMAGELTRMIRDVTLGANMEDAIVAWGQRIPGPDLDIVINAILVQRTVGGNLGEILDTVGETMRQRERLKGEISALTAQQRLSGIVVGVLPIAVGGFITVVNPEYMSPMFNEPLGKVILVVAGFMEIASFFVIKKILDIEI